MNVASLKRDAKRVGETLKTLPDGSVVTTTGCTIVIPEKYVEKQLAFLGNDVSILGVYAIVTPDGFYAVSSAMCMLRVDPTSNTKVTIDDTSYLVLEFQKNSNVLLSSDVVKRDVVAYQVYDFFVDAGNVPWFMTYTDMLKLFYYSDKYAGISFGANHAIIPLIVSNIARNPNNKVQYYRQIVEEDRNAKPAWIPFKSVIYGPKTTTAKLSGAYFDSALVSALTIPNDRKEKVETLLRS